MNQQFNTSQDILARLHHQRQLMDETQDFIQAICEDLLSSQPIQNTDTTKSKVNMISVIMKALHDSFKINMNHDIENKFYEYEELLQIQLKDKITQRNSFEVLRLQIAKDNDFVKEKLKNLEKLQFQRNSTSGDHEGNDLLKKLNEVQNQTDFLLQRVNEFNTSTHKEYDTHAFIKDLEQKVDYLYKNANSEIIGEGKDILNTFRMLIQLYNTCKMMLKQIPETDPDKLILIRPLNDIENLIYDQVEKILNHVYSDLKSLYSKLKAKLDYKD